MYPEIKTALPKSGIDANMNTCAGDDPLHSGGAGVLFLFHYQGAFRTTIIVDQCNRYTPTG